MIDKIQSELDAIQARSDSRISYCDLKATMMDHHYYRLTGAVLNAETLAEVADQLTRTFKDAEFETGEVKILLPGRPLWVGTSVTGLYAGPSFARDMASQIVSGSIVEELISQDKWSLVRTADRYLGWAYRPYLVEDRPADATHLASAPVSPLRANPSVQAPLVGRLVAGATFRVEQQEEGWAHLVSAAGALGWTQVTHLRSLEELPRSESSRRQQIIADATSFMGIPYLWGGLTGYGLDCSGYIQLLHRLVGLPIPRDADLQFDAGLPVEPPFEPGDLLFFSSPGGHRHISHMGMSMGGWHLIHSSRARNGVHEDDVKEVDWLNDTFAGARTFLNQSAG